ncbi:MAG: amino acid ABC transporter substrate-binding protein [Burkholderiales bacterium]|nr:amino acid ABC transporter substrate-binding protein [Burkholderiales bacterium]
MHHQVHIRAAFDRNGGPATQVKAAQTITVHILVLWIASCFSSQLQAQTLEFAVSEWPPAEYSVNGQAHGYHPDIVRAVLKSLDMDAKFTFYPWKRSEMLVERKKVAAILSLHPTKERQRFLYFPKEHLSTSENVLFVVNGREFNTPHIDALAGKTVGTTSGYDYGTEFKRVVAAGLVRTDVGNTDEQGFLKLLAGRFDAFVCDRAVGSRLLKSLGLSATVHALPLVISSVRMYAGFAKTPENAVLVDKFDAALRKLKASGEHQKIMDANLK